MKNYFITIVILLFFSPLVFAVEGKESKTEISNVAKELFVTLEFKKELIELKKEVSDLKKEIKGLKSLIESRFPTKPSSLPGYTRPITAKTSIKDDPFLGSKDAPLILVEFSDYQCPFCGSLFRDTLPQLKKAYINTGKLRYVFKDFPLSFHNQAEKAAEAAHCAGEEGKYWEMHDLVFQNQRQMGMNNLIDHAKKLRLNIVTFKNCLEDGRYAEGIKKDMEQGQLSGVTGTPSFILGKVNGDSEVNGRIIRGARPYGTFKRAIEAMLKK